MNWDEVLARMESKLIKVDSMAVDDEYFMATHVPFYNLEVRKGGESGSESIQMDENSIYEELLIKNHKENSQMIIVRGVNGTGKSHMISWLHKRLLHDGENYDKDKTEIIFLRRLNNTIRGAIKQLLDKGLIKEPLLKDKIKRFLQASDAKNETEFKLRIYSEYCNAALADTSDKEYDKAMRDDIYSFLNDKRVRAELLKAGGPIDRCYRMVNNSVQSVVREEQVFCMEDFKLPRTMCHELRNEGAQEAGDFYFLELKKDAEKKRLADYLNQFTSKVLQSCADISSESVRDLFCNLRQELQQEGKSLILLIEDFTSFTMIESELIVALSTDGGGDFSDLCPVTSFIGITDGYYDSFRDNLKDRVAWQININSQPFGEDDFLLSMVARYLNAVYCDPEELRIWNQNGCAHDMLPINQFTPPYAWDSWTIEGQNVTLFPFNKKSLHELYQRLQGQTPRRILTKIISAFFANYVEERIESFPVISSDFVPKIINQEFADNIEASLLNSANKKRLKNLFVTWGDGTTFMKEDSIGGLPRGFLKDLNLDTFVGLVKTERPSKEKTVAKANASSINLMEKPTITNKTGIEKKQSDLNKREVDINTWCDAGAEIKYGTEYNSFIKTFILQAIPWQDEDIPVYFVKERASSGSFSAIEGQKANMVKAENVIVYLERNEESKRFLLALCYFNYANKSWNFKGAEYSQVTLITWLLKNKEGIKTKICERALVGEEKQIVTWSLALRYLCAILKRVDIKYNNSLDLLCFLLNAKLEENGKEHSNNKWQAVCRGLKNNEAILNKAQDYLRYGEKTVQGVINTPNFSPEKAPNFFRVQELLRSIQHLQECNWDIRLELLEKKNARRFEVLIEALSSLYNKVDEVLTEEKRRAVACIEKVNRIFGKVPDKDLLQEVCTDIQKFYRSCAHNNINYSSKVKMTFDGKPVDFADKVNEKLTKIQNAMGEKDTIIALYLFSTDIVRELDVILDDLLAVQRLADEDVQRYCNNEIEKITGIDECCLEKFRKKVKNLFVKIDMEGEKK